MKPEEAEKLLGGHAAGTLTPEERRSLFAAALEDQQLYEALVREEPLRELLADPAARANLLAALGDVPKPWYYHDVHPGIIAAAVSAVVIVFLGVRLWPVRTAPPVTVVSQAELPQPTKSDLPTGLLFPERQAEKVKPLPPPPVVTAAPSAPALPPAVNDVLAQSVPRPVRPEEPPAGTATATAASLTRPQALVQARGAPATLAVRYTILKKLPDGEFAAVNPGQTLDSTDEAVIRLEPNDSGFLYVLERADSGDWRPIASERVRASLPYTVPKNATFHAEHPGPREFLVLFSRQPQNIAAGFQPAIALAREQKAATGGYPAEVVSTSPSPSAQVSFPITLNYR